MTRSRWSTRCVALCAVVWGTFPLVGRTQSLTPTPSAEQAATSTAADAKAQQPPAPFGEVYASLDPRRQRLIDNWVARFNEVTRRKVAPASFYDSVVNFSAKTTFEAVTHALMTTQLTDTSGEQLGDALALVEQVDAVRGKVTGAASDHQFRMYVRLTEGALATLGRSREFKRHADNAVYHKGYPINYRAEGGTPSIQISVALDQRRADIDVDYRSSSFPVGLFNGHLTAANSDVRVGDNYDRHINRWVGFQNWWRGFFGVPVGGQAVDQVPDRSLAIPKEPRAGRKDVDAMMHDFLTAWLVEGNIVATMGYVSERALACLAEERDDPSSIDRGMAPLLLVSRLKAAHDALGSRNSLEGLTIGVRLTRPGLRVVTQPYHAQFVIYSVPDDVAAAFNCESRMTLGDPKKIRRAYGNYFGATFYINGRQDRAVALLWAKENGYWKIVSWQAEPDEEDAPGPSTTPDVKVARIQADASLVAGARAFLESWWIRKDYDTAFRYLSPRSYACYDLFRKSNDPAATSLEDAGRHVRAALERAGQAAGTPSSLESMISAVDPTHPALRIMSHRDERSFALASAPDALAAYDCAARARGESFTGQLPPVYGNVGLMSFRVRTQSGEGPVLRTLWLKESGAWRITTYDVELP
jgi:hypothetical protein